MVPVQERMEARLHFLEFYIMGRLRKNDGGYLPGEQQMAGTELRAVDELGDGIGGGSSDNQQIPP